MNFIDAIRLWKPLRRRGRKSWPRKTCHGEHSSAIICDPQLDQWMDPAHLLDVCILDQQDILTDDWEVKEITVTITYSQFWRAFDRQSHQSHAAIDVADAIARELGLTHEPPPA